MDEFKAAREYANKMLDNGCIDVQSAYDGFIAGYNYRNNTKSIFPVDPNGLLPEEYFPHVELWLRYKKEKGQSYKQTGFKLLCKKLLKMTNGDADYALQCIEESMANNYTGIFPAKTYNNGFIQKGESQFDKDIRESYEQAAGRFISGNH